MVAVPSVAAAQVGPTCNGQVATVVLADGDVATSGPDVIVGTSSADTILGYGGDDVICGFGGRDVIDGGSGDDTIFGGGGHDVIDGGLGNDVLYGQPGADTMHGGAGNDRVLGGTGFDRLYGDDGNDFVQGSGGDDTLYGGPGDDALFGKTGADIVFGGAGDDQIYGAGGDDEAHGGNGDDRLQGAGGDDHLDGGAGDDVLYGQNDDDVMSGGDGNDALYAAAGADQLSGGEGDDRLQGAGGNDSLDGDAGRDILFGQAGQDTFRGGTNTDFCYRAAGESATGCEGPATDLAGLEALWASTRADVIEEIATAGYGVGTDNVLRGPGGFEVNLNDCPADWSNTDGISGGTITVAHTMAQSGALAAYGQIGTGMGAYFDYVNTTGGIGPDGLTINLVLSDDEYVATRTQQLVDDLLSTPDPFWISTLGSPNSFSVYDRLNVECVPQPFVASGHQAWGDPVEHPWTTGLQLTYATEAHLWVEWIEQNLAADTPVTVSALVMDNDFGLAYEQRFADLAAQSPVIGSVQFVRHDPTARNLTNEFSVIAANNPDVYISMTAGNPCLLAILAAESSGLASGAKALFTPSVCKAVSAYLDPAGDAADGWLTVDGGVKGSTDPTFAAEPFVAFLHDTLSSAGLDSTRSLYGTGFGLFGWAHVEALRIAAGLPGGLTRTNFLLAQRGLDLFHPLVTDGVAFEMNGALDAYLVEGSPIARFDVERRSWELTGRPIDVNGQMPPCTWTAGAGC